MGLLPCRIDLNTFLVSFKLDRVVLIELSLP